VLACPLFILDLTILVTLGMPYLLVCSILLLLPFLTCLIWCGYIQQTYVDRPSWVWKILVCHSNAVEDSTKQATNKPTTQSQICSVLPNKDSVMPAISRHASVDTHLKAGY
jgi:hypothetical protein